MLDLSGLKYFSAVSVLPLLYHMRAKYELNRAAPLVTDPPRANSPTRQNPPICNPPLYIATTSEQNMQFQNYF